MNAIVFRDLELDDLKAYKFWKKPNHEYNKFNGPYFKQATELEQENFFNVINLFLPFFSDFEDFPDFPDRSGSSF